jgi:hypothetical protein
MVGLGRLETPTSPYQDRALGYRNRNRGGVWQASYKIEGFHKAEKFASSDAILNPEGA